MRLIRAYKNWTSAGALISAVLSDEELTVVEYGAPPLSLSLAIITAIKKAKQMFWAATVQKVNSVFWAGFLIAFVLWPIAKIPKDIQTFFLILFGMVFCVNLVGLVSICVMRLKFGKFDFASLKHVQGPDLAPPVTAHRDKEIKAPGLKHSILFFLVFVFLNCYAMASPAYPAKIGNTYRVESSFVAPWASWESTTKIHQGSMIAIVTAPETDQIYVARARYVVRQVGVGNAEWLEWTTNRLSWLTSQITQNLSQNMPTDITSETVVPWILEVWEGDIDGETPLGVLRDAMIANFYARYDGEFELLSLEINIEHISLNQYRKEAQ